VAKRAKIEDEDEDSIDGFYDEHRDKLQIDKHALDDMWLEQPGIIQAIGERLALEISRRDEAKDDLADITSELDGIVRESHVEDEKKPTETAIKNEIAQDPKVKKAKKRFRTLELNVSRLQMLRESFTQRRYALQDLVTLYVAGYYTSNSGAAKGAREATHETSRKAMQAARKRSRED
jgi:hypothetical protein